MEQCYFYELAGKRGTGETAVLLRNREGSLGSTLRFSLKQLPCFTLWKNTAALEDGYVTGLEPATDYPNPRPFERRRGRVMALKPGETRRFSLTAAVHNTKRGVRDAESLIRGIQKSVKPRVSEGIIKRFSPLG